MPTINDLFKSQVKEIYGKSEKLRIDTRGIINAPRAAALLGSSPDALSSLIGNTTNFINFVNNLNNVLKPKKMTKLERVKDFNYNELNLLLDSNIIIYKNTPTTFIEEKIGLNVLIKINTRLVLIQGIIKEDILELYKSNELIQNRFNEIKEFVNCINIHYFCFVLDLHLN